MRPMWCFVGPELNANVRYPDINPKPNRNPNTIVNPNNIANSDSNHNTQKTNEVLSHIAAM